jgi:serine/threonine protein phosphatase PrpC
VGVATISARIAELPATLTGTGEDRVRVGQNSVVVLDGASGTDSNVTVSEYVDHLADSLVEALDSNPAVLLTEALAASIDSTATTLDLHAGRAPSSTVSIVRLSGTVVDALILGDSPVYVAHNGNIDRLSDNRLARLDLPSRTRLFERLAAGHGYDDHQHNELARQMPGEKASHRNRPGGYWIAEADAQAGVHALVHSYSAYDVTWCAMLTDGIDEPASHLGIAVKNLVIMEENELRETLYQIHRWETETDPHAKRLPRFKRHDDKTIAVVRFT